MNNNNNINIMNIILEYITFHNYYFNQNRKILQTIHFYHCIAFQFLAEAINLFLRENGQEVLKLMEPQLKKKLSTLFAGIVNQLLRHVPVESFLVP